MKNFCLWSQLSRFPTLQLPTRAFLTHCPESRPGSVTLEFTELFLFSPSIGRISFSVWEILFPFCFFTGKLFPSSGTQGFCEQKSESVVVTLSFSALLQTSWWPREPEPATCLREEKKRKNTYREKNMCLYYSLKILPNYRAIGSLIYHW